MNDDIIPRLKDLQRQATTERSHYYTGECVGDAIEEIERLREALERIRDYQYCDAYNMVKKIAGAALGREE